MEVEANAKADVVSPTRTPVADADRRILPILYLGMFVAMRTFVTPATFFPVMACDLDVNVPLLGQVVAAMWLVSTTIGLIAGPLGDRYGHRRVILGLVSAAVCLLAFGLAPIFALLLVGPLAGAWSMRRRSVPRWPLPVCTSCVERLAGL